MRRRGCDTSTTSSCAPPNQKKRYPTGATLSQIDMLILNRNDGELDSVRCESGRTKEILKHFLAALAYRTQKALRDAPPEFAEFRAAPKVRTPHELVRHMDSVLGYARTFLVGGSYRPPDLPELRGYSRAFSRRGRRSGAPSGCRRRDAWHYTRGDVARSVFRCNDACRPVGDAAPVWLAVQFHRRISSTLPFRLRTLVPISHCPSVPMKCGRRNHERMLWFRR